jgi:hypothetical protein
MRLSLRELASVRTYGLYLFEKCDGCGKLLNQTFRHTIAGKSEVYCTATCRDLVFFGNCKEPTKRSTPGKCVYCRASLEGKRRGRRYCDEICKKRAASARRSLSTAELQITGTRTQSNHRVVDAKTVEQGDRITRLLHGSKIALSDPNPPAGKSAM